MKSFVDKQMVNELLILLGHSNISITDKPCFLWDGDKVIETEISALEEIPTNSEIKQVLSYTLNEELNFSNFLNLYQDKKIVLMAHSDGKLINEQNIIRAFISN